MNSTEAADIVEYLVGAYPGTYFKGPTAEVFVNSLLTNDRVAATDAAKQWVNTMDRFPTIAELNGVIRSMRSRETGRSLPAAPPNVATREQARDAFSRGYIRARSEAGESMEEIQPKLDRLLREWGLTPATEEERRARTGAGRQQTAPSARRLGDRPWNTEPQEVRPSAGSATIDEPW